MVVRAEVWVNDINPTRGNTINDGVKATASVKHDGFRSGHSATGGPMLKADTVALLTDVTALHVWQVDQNVHVLISGYGSYLRVHSQSGTLLATAKVFESSRVHGAELYQRSTRSDVTVYPSKHVLALVRGGRDAQVVALDWTPERTTIQLLASLGPLPHWVMAAAWAAAPARTWPQPSAPVAIVPAQQPAAALATVSLQHQEPDVPEAVSPGYHVNTTGTDSHGVRLGSSTLRRSAAGAVSSSAEGPVAAAVLVLGLSDNSMIACCVRLDTQWEVAQVLPLGKVLCSARCLLYSMDLLLASDDLFSHSLQHVGSGSSAQSPTEAAGISSTADVGLAHHHRQQTVDSVNNDTTSADTVAGRGHVNASAWVAAGSVFLDVLIWKVSMEAFLEPYSRDLTPGQGPVQVPAQGLQGGAALLSGPVWSVAPLLKLQGHEGSIHRVRWSGTPRLLASGSDDRTVRLWQLTLLAQQQGGAEATNDLAASRRDATVSSTAVSPNAVVDPKSRLEPQGTGQPKLAQPLVVQQVHVLSGLPGRIWDCCFDTDTTRHSAPSAQATNAAQQAAGMHTSKSVAGRSGDHPSCGMFPELLSVGCEDSSCIVYDVATRCKLATIKGHRGRGVRHCVLHCWRLYTAGADGAVKSWDLRAWMDVQKVPLYFPPTKKAGLHTSSVPIGSSLEGSQGDQNGWVLRQHYILQPPEAEGTGVGSTASKSCVRSVCLLSDSQVLVAVERCALYLVHWSHVGGAGRMRDHSSGHWQLLVQFPCQPAKQLQVMRPTTQSSDVVVYLGTADGWIHIGKLQQRGNLHGAAANGEAGIAAELSYVLLHSWQPYPGRSVQWLLGHSDCTDHLLLSAGSDPSFAMWYTDLSSPPQPRACSRVCSHASHITQQKGSQDLVGLAPLQGDQIALARAHLVGKGCSPHSGTVSCVAICPSRRFVAWGDTKGNLLLFQWGQEGMVEKTIGLGRGIGTSEQALATVQQAPEKLRLIASSQRVHGSSNVCMVCFAPDGFLYSGGKDSRLRRYRVADVVITSVNSGSPSTYGMPLPCVEVQRIVGLTVLQQLAFSPWGNMLVGFQSTMFTAVKLDSAGREPLVQHECGGFNRPLSLLLPGQPRPMGRSAPDNHTCDPLQAKSKLSDGEAFSIAAQALMTFAYAKTGEVHIVQCDPWGMLQLQHSRGNVRAAQTCQFRTELPVLGAGLPAQSSVDTCAVKGGMLVNTAASSGRMDVAHHGREIHAAMLLSVQERMLMVSGSEDGWVLAAGLPSSNCSSGSACAVPWTMPVGQAVEAAAVCCMDAVQLTDDAWLVASAGARESCKLWLLNWFPSSEKPTCQQLADRNNLLRQTFVGSPTAASQVEAHHRFVSVHIVYVQQSREAATVLNRTGTTPAASMLGQVTCNRTDPMSAGSQAAARPLDARASANATSPLAPGASVVQGNQAAQQDPHVRMVHLMASLANGRTLMLLYEVQTDSWTDTAVLEGHDDYPALAACSWVATCAAPTQHPTLGGCLAGAVGQLFDSPSVAKVPGEQHAASKGGNSQQMNRLQPQTYQDICSMYMATGATNGSLAVWAVDQLVATFNKDLAPAARRLPIAQSPSMHQSAINAVSAAALIDGRTAVLTAGDDQALGLLLLQGLVIAATLCLPNAHASSIRGIWTDGQLALSVGLDQKLRAWQLHLPCAPPVDYHGHNGGEKKQVGKAGWASEVGAVFVQVLEPEALHVLPRAGNHLLACVAGRGAQVLQIATDGLRDG